MNADVERRKGGLPDMTPSNMSISTLRIVVIAMTVGVAAFTGVVYAIGSTRGALGRPASSEIMLAVLAALAAGAALAYFVVRRVIVSQLQRRCAGLDSHEDVTTLLMSQFFTLTVLGCALAEGPGLFGAVIYLLTQNALALLAPALAVLLLLAQFPTDGRFGSFSIAVLGRDYSMR